MKPTSVAVLTTLVVLLAPALLRAQSPAASPAAEPPPDPPYVAPVPQRAAWTITVDKPATATPGATPANVPADSPNAAVIRQLDIVRTGDLSRVLITSLSGGQIEYYHIGSSALMLDKARNNRPKILALNPQFPLYNYYSTGFFGMDRVKAKDFQRTVELKGVRCHYYRGVSLAAGEGGGESTYEAWVDEKTRLPVVYREAGSTLIFTFTAPPDVDLQLPAPLNEAWKEYQTDRARAQGTRAARR